MECLKAELETVLGERLGRIEEISQQPYAHLYMLYSLQGNKLPIIAKAYLCQGIAEQEAYKLSLLAREGNVRLPTVYGMDAVAHTSYHETLLIEYLPGVSVTESMSMSEHWSVLMDQIVESLLRWHRIDSGGLVGTVGNMQELSWESWYQQKLEWLWQELSCCSHLCFTHQDIKILYRSKERLTQFFSGFNDNSVLVHGNLTLRCMLKDSYSDQLLAMINPGMMLWAPREYELFRLIDDDRADQLLARYLERAPVDELFIARRWLYLLWNSVSHYFYTGYLDQDKFKQACQGLIPWLE